MPDQTTQAWQQQKARSPGTHLKAWQALLWIGAIVVGVVIAIFLADLL